MPTIRHYPDAPAFLADTAALLEADELDNNFILGLAAGNSTPSPDRTYVAAVEHGAVVAAALRAGSMLFISPTRHDDALRILARYFDEHGTTPLTVIAPLPTTEGFASHYRPERAGERARLIVHGLDAVAPVAMPAGVLETPESGHVELLTQWIHAFHVDAGLPPMPDDTVRAQLARRMASGNFFIWTRGGEPVSMTAMMRATRHIAIVGLVYTPPEYRGHGYATGLVAQQSQLLLQRGYTRCGLFTDADNPTSNHIYAKIGYRAGTEFLEISWQ